MMLISMIVSQLILDQIKLISQPYYYIMFILLVILINFQLIQHFHWRLCCLGIKSFSQLPTFQVLSWNNFKILSSSTLFLSKSVNEGQFSLHALQLHSNLYCCNNFLCLIFLGVSIKLTPYESVTSSPSLISLNKQRYKRIYQNNQCDGVSRKVVFLVNTSTPYKMDSKNI